MADLRKSANLNQSDIAAISGKSRQTINTWESKETCKVPKSIAEKIAQVLGVKLEDLTKDRTFVKDEYREKYIKLLEENLKDLKLKLAECQKNIPIPPLPIAKPSKV